MFSKSYEAGEEFVVRDRKPADCEIVAWYGEDRWGESEKYTTGRADGKKESIRIGDGWKRHASTAGMWHRCASICPLNSSTKESDLG